MSLRPRTIRGRVAGWVLLIVMVALSLNLLAVSAYLYERDRAAVELELEHESVKFHRFLQTNRAAAVPMESVSELLRAYIAGAFPDTHESMFSVVGAKAEYRTRTADPVRLDLDDAMVSRASRARKPYTAALDSDDGPAVASVIPVQAEGAGGQRGALVIVEATEARRESLAGTVRLLALLGVGALAVTGLVSWVVAGRVAAPLRQVRRTAEAIDEERLSARIPTTDETLDDDVVAMATTFNRMLDRLELALSSQRDFLDDAAHEMRTPLTVIRGHLEVMGDDPPDRRATSRLLIEEVDRMDRMVTDLLLLARSVRPDFLDRGSVDLDDLVVKVVATASALGDRRWRVAGTAGLRVLADEQRLTQALMQLVANAVRHTHAHDTIEVGVDTGTEEVVLTVTDTGPGIPAPERDRIFDRFYQGPRSEGSGLGLAIVGSIAAAHGGRVELAPDSSSQGACFRLVLPRTEAAHSAAPRMLQGDGVGGGV